MVEGTRKAVVMAVAAGILVMGLLGMMAVPVHAATDPIWYLDCTNPTPTLDQSNPVASGTCAATATLTASGLSGASFLVGSTSNVQITVQGAVANAGSYTLTDTTTSTTIATGTFSGAGTVAGCSAFGNTVLGSGAGNVGTKVTATDTLTLTISFTSPSGGAALCTGQAAGSNTSTSIGISAAVPEFAIGAILPVALGLFLLKAKVRFWGRQTAA